MKPLSARRRTGLLALAVAALLALGALGAAAATPPKQPTGSHCPKPKAGKKAPARCAGQAATKPAKPSAADQLCHLGQAWVNGHYRKPACKANPIFAKAVCATFVPAVEALDPNVTINDGYFPSWTGTEVGCWYVVNGRKQGLDIHVSAATASAFAQAEQIETESMDCPYPSESYMEAHPDAGPPSQPAVNTTIDGYRAWTWDPCVDPQPDSPQHGALVHHGMAVLAGTADIEVHWDAPYVDLTSAQMLPLVQKLIGIYKTP